MADSSSAASYSVHLGPWTDWSRGRILGAMLTLTRNDGNLLIAFLAFYVSLVGTRLWRIVLLRNAPNPDSSFFTLLNLIRSWRRYAITIWMRMLPTLVLAAICMCGITVATGFSSRVATVTNGEALLVGARCGYIDLSLSEDNLTALMELKTPTILQDLISADNYARQCYASGTLAGLECGTFVKTRLLPSIVNTTAGCLFDPNICLSNSSNLFLDSGLIDSHTDLGRNAPADQRFQYRRVVHCAPLATERYKSYINTTGENPKVRYHYGGLITDDGSALNYTEEFLRDSYISLKTLQQTHGDTGYDYSIRFDLAEPMGGSVNPTTSSFVPIPELAKPDADVYLFFLTAGGVTFGEPINDPWYRATRFEDQLHQMQQNHLTGNLAIYRQNEPGSPLACLDQHQLCFSGSPRDNKCTNLMSAADLQSHAYLHQFFDDDEKRRDIEWMLNTTVDGVRKILHPVSTLSLQALLSRGGINGGHQARLPDNQWQLEVRHWYSIVMAHLQQLFINAAIGPQDSKLDAIYHFAETPTEKRICGSQKARVEDYISFSVFGLALIFAGGGAVILMSWGLEPLSAYLIKRNGYRPYAQLEWSSNEILQLQRLANEGIGLGTWSGAIDAIPMTNPGELLGVLDIVDANHPKLREPTGMSSVVDLDINKHADVRVDEIKSLGDK